MELTVDAGTENILDTIISALEEAIRDEEAFTKAFKHKLTDPIKLGAGAWGWDNKAQAFGLVTPNGSILKLRFYNTVKPIFDYMNVEVPGKESFLSYIEVIVRPAGIKGYMFKSDVRQAVWGDSKSAAQAKHDHGIFLLKAKATGLGIEIADDQWVTKYDRTNY